MRVLIAAGHAPFDPPATRATALVDAARGAGHEAEFLPIPFTAADAGSLADGMLLAALLEAEWHGRGSIDRLIALDFAGLLVRHASKTAWLDGPGPTLSEDDPEHAHLRHRVRAVERRQLAACHAAFATEPDAAASIETACGLRPAVLAAPEDPAGWAPFLERLLA